MSICWSSQHSSPVTIDRHNSNWHIRFRFETFDFGDVVGWYVALKLRGAWARIPPVALRVVYYLHDLALLEAQVLDRPRLVVVQGDELRECGGCSRLGGIPQRRSTRPRPLRHVSCTTRSRRAWHHGHSTTVLRPKASADRGRRVGMALNNSGIQRSARSLGWCVSTECLPHLQLDLTYAVYTDLAAVGHRRRLDITQWTETVGPKRVTQWVTSIVLNLWPSASTASFRLSPTDNATRNPTIYYFLLFIFTFHHKDPDKAHTSLIRLGIRWAYVWRTLAKHAGQSAQPAGQWVGLPLSNNSLPGYLTG